MPHYLDVPEQLGRELSPAEFAARQFFRPPAWRSERAGHLMGRKAARLRSSTEDPCVLAAYRYLKDEQRLKAGDLTRQDLNRKLAHRHPVLYYAYEFVSEPSGSMGRAALEAMILSGMDDAKIAGRTGRDPYVARAYRELFYDVSDRLLEPDYIAGFVLGPVFQAGLGALNVELMAKYFGYFGGPVLLDHVLYGMERITTLTSDGEVLGFLEDTISRGIKQQTAAMMLLMQPGRFDIRSLLEGYTAIVKLEHEHQNSSRESQWLTQLTDVLQELNPVPRSMEQRRNLGERIHSLNPDLPMEPRKHENELLAKGELSAAELSDRLSQFVRPPPSGPQDPTETDNS